MVPFYGWGSTASRLEPLPGGSLLFTTNSPEIPGTLVPEVGVYCALYPFWENIFTSQKNKKMSAY